VRLRVVKHTDDKTLKPHMVRFTQPTAFANTDEWIGYSQIPRPHVTVNHGEHKGARDDAGGGIREAHINTAEGMWTGRRNFFATVPRSPQRLLGGLWQGVNTASTSNASHRNLLRR
jgi:hypothetical protein